MFGSSVLDVAVGLIFVFLAVSLAAGALTEAVASLVKLRQRTLLSGIQALLNDPGFTGLAKDLYNHALVNPLGTGAAATVAQLTAKPAYIEARDFAAALVSALEARTPDQPLDKVLATVPDPQLKAALQLLYRRAASDRVAFVAAVGAWFDAAMDRVAGWYKRYTQVVAFAAALLVCACLNADALRVSSALWRRPSLVAELQAAAARQGADMPPAQGVVDQLTGAGLLGWSGTVPRGGAEVVSMLFGWLIVAGASLFGAPFWFDALKRISNVAGVGPGKAAGRTDPAPP